ncbi:DEKNAAC101277 [Brettanomyces naardenensis]|uniref:DEKNAAC101277 n=1 Tax=Brettanomyces naardenensis TaxID=13370 RepID=A0A448YHS6_BRENA|nr:DEKNAAC101277 [Brettanomyces naardenensis]
MQKDYILRIESSETKYPDLVYQHKLAGLRSRRRLRRESESGKDDVAERNGLEKYVKFTARRSRPRTILTVDMAVELLVSAMFTVVLFHTLSQVNPIEKLFTAVYRQVSSLNQLSNDSPTKPEHVSFLRSVLQSMEAVGFAKGSSLEFSVSSILNLLYFAVAAKVVDWLAWQVDNDIEESLLIIPQLGIQSESVMLKKSLGKLYLRFLLALARLVVSRAGLLVNVCQSRLTGRVERASQTERGVRDAERKRSRLDKLDKALQSCERLVLCREFVAMEYVKDLVINEGFINFQVIFYLALVTIDTSSTSLNGRDGSKSSCDERLKMIVVFPNLLPRRKLLEAVWRRSRKFLN